MFFSPPPISPEFYLDPGSGSILFQMVVAALLGGGILIRTQWARIKRWFGKNSENADTDSDDEENSDR